MKKSVDLNCDMGENFGRWQVSDGADKDLIGHISSANIAAGFHAGDPNIIDATVRLAKDHGVSVGAHPGYNDLQGFGRRRINGTSAELINDIVYQVGAVREFTRRHNVALQHIKPHGALYMELAANYDMSVAFVAYLQIAAHNTPLFCMAGSATERAAREVGHPVVREFYADRDYGDDGFIVFTRGAGALDPQRVAEKCLRACTDGKVRTVNGLDITIEFESICLHSDTPGALAIAMAIHAALADAGIRIAPASRFPSI